MRERAGERSEEQQLLQVPEELVGAPLRQPAKWIWLFSGLTLFLGAVAAARHFPRFAGSVRLDRDQVQRKTSVSKFDELEEELKERNAPVSSAVATTVEKLGIAIHSGDANYDTVFNETMFDCLEAERNTSGQAFCFDAIMARDKFCRGVLKSERASCEAVKQCLLGYNFSEPTNPCEEFCKGKQDEAILENCRVQFEAAQHLSRICVPRYEPHDQHVDWRVLQTMKYVMKMASRCGWKAVASQYGPSPDSWELDSGSPRMPPLLNQTRFPKGSMLCFSLMLPGAQWIQLIGMQDWLNASIFGCDEFAVYAQSVIKIGKIWTRQLLDTNIVAPTDPQTHQVMNTLVFRNLWRQVMDEGRWRFHDWTIKVDTDAVFFPFRLRSILRQPPYAEAGKKRTGLLLNNCNSGFQGAIEVLSKEALHTFDKSWLHCPAHPPEESTYLVQCMAAHNVAILEARALLASEACDQPKADYKNCSAGDFVTFHPRQHVDEWKACWSEVVPAPAISHSMPPLPTRTYFPNGSMFCFTLMWPGDLDHKLVGLQKYFNASIFACDESAVYSESVTEVGDIWTRQLLGVDIAAPKGPHARQVRGTDVFKHLWRQVMDEGRWRFHDWTIKVDTDAVFFAVRLRLTLNDPLYVAAGENHAGVLLNNCKSSYQGAIEVLSKPAMRAFNESWKHCPAKAHLEAAYLEECMVFNKVKILDAKTLLASEACTEPKTDYEHCSTGEFATFHPRRDPEQWKACWTEGMLAPPKPAWPTMPPLPKERKFPDGSMFCFTLMWPGDQDQKLLGLQNFFNASIFACDESAVYSEHVTQVGKIWTRQLLDTELIAPKDPHTHQIRNTKVYRNLWRQVMNEGRWRFHDWTIKVDLDAVFFAFRLRFILNDPFYAAAGKKPKGVLLDNCNSDYQGAIEVLSKKAIYTFNESWKRCPPEPPEEAAYLAQCVAAQGVTILDAKTLLAAKSCKKPGADYKNCSMGNIVTFHPMARPDQWKACWADVFRLPV
eukprot:TRINITY_DN2009_c0_g1_i1.p1 TRINITY_DN2009_c0_g1~~TRINITY_DN2009_c0_g1_i1.p1  ORF type:complete len:999 (+),score=138.72 TRINITY_DN2009_c0_g1_i1:69-3065(+)